MGKDLHPSILRFFKDRMEEHQGVEKIEDISTEEYYIFKVYRRRGFSPITVLFDDSYHYGEFNALTTQTILSNGGMVLIAKPENSFGYEDNDYENKILTGKIGILMGAINKEEFWKYKKPKKKKEKY